MFKLLIFFMYFVLFLVRRDYCRDIYYIMILFMFLIVVSELGLLLILSDYGWEIFYFFNCNNIIFDFG